MEINAEQIEYRVWTFLETSKQDEITTISNKSFDRVEQFKY
jgi:hypothetical protein